MADTKISDLAAVTDVIGTDEYVLARAGTSKKIAASNLVPVSLITDTTLGADTQTISFTSIAASWAHLRLAVMLRTDSSNNDLGMRFNADTGANYDWENLLVSSTNVLQPTQGVAQTSLTAGYVGASTYPANEFGMYVIQIPFYRSGQLKKFIAEGHVRAAASAANLYRVDGGGTWRNTAAITQIDLFAVSKFVAGSRAILYGLT